MILSSSTQNIERSGSSQEIQFSAILGAKAFDILSSAIYSDKPLAIIRELSCNMYDGHIAAGKKDVPPEIVLPTVFDPTLTFRDFGTGLSDEQICGYWIEAGGTRKDGTIAANREFANGIYTTYFESSKSDSNEYIGALGLGSKSPFSYVDAFIIESRQNGVKRIYSAFKNEQRIPSIAKMSEIPTEEMDGLTVSLSVDHADIATFENAAKRALMYFDPMPVFVGQEHFRPYALKHSFVGNNWKIRETEYWANMSGPYVVQGLVSYPINTSVLDNADLSISAKRLLSTNIDLTVPMGDVTVAPSREALSYDPATIKNLVFAFEQAASEIQHSFQVRFDQCQTQWEMAMLYCSIVDTPGGLSPIFVGMNKVSPYQWVAPDGQTFNVGSNVGFSITDTNIAKALASTCIKHMSIASVRGQTYKLKNEHASLFNDELAFSITKNTILIVDDLAKSSDKTIMAYLAAEADKRANVRKTDIKAIVISPNTKRNINHDDQATLVNLFENPAHVLVSSMPYVGKTTNKQVAGRRPKEMVRRWIGFVERATRGSYHRKQIVRKFSKLTWANTELPTALPTTGGMYVLLDRFSIEWQGSTQFHFDEILACSIEIGLIPAGTIIYGVNKVQYEKLIKDDKQWIDFLSLAKTGLDGWLKTNPVDNQVVRQLLRSTMGDDKLRFFSSICSGDIVISQSGAMNKFIDQLRPYFQTSANIDLIKSMYLRLNRKQLSDTTKANSIVKKLTNSMEFMMTDDYPVLSVVDCQHWSTPVVLKYVAQCDEAQLTPVPMFTLDIEQNDVDAGFYADKIVDSVETQWL